MSHPHKHEAKSGQEMAKARYSVDYDGPDDGKTLGDAAQPPKEEWTAAPARQVSNTGKVRK
jgi:hypothetical protein